MAFREVTLADGTTRVVDTGVAQEEIVHPNGVTQRRSIIGQLFDENQNHPAGNAKLNYNAGMTWAIAEGIGQAVYMYNNRPGFFDAQLNPVSDLDAARAGFDVPKLKAQWRKQELIAEAEAKIERMKASMKADMEAELAEAEEAEMGSKWETPHVPDVAPASFDKDVRELADDGVRAWPVKK
jgi:hypothetical protein